MVPPEPVAHGYAVGDLKEALDAIPATDEYRDVGEIERPGRIEEEVEAVGLNHAELAEYILHQWRLPDSIIEAIRDHLSFYPAAIPCFVGGERVALAQEWLQLLLLTMASLGVEGEEALQDAAV